MVAVTREETVDNQTKVLCICTPQSIQNMCVSSRSVDLTSPGPSLGLQGTADLVDRRPTTAQHRTLSAVYIRLLTHEATEATFVGSLSPSMWRLTTGGHLLEIHGWPRWQIRVDFKVAANDAGFNANRVPHRIPDFHGVAQMTKWKGNVIPEWWTRRRRK